MHLTAIFYAICLSSQALAATQGNATFYYQGDLGICKKIYKDPDLVVLINAAWNKKSRCGQSVCIRNYGGGGQYNQGLGKEVVATIDGVCPSCSINDLGILISYFCTASCETNTQQLELSIGAFEALTGGYHNPPTSFNIEW